MRRPLPIVSLVLAAVVPIAACTATTADGAGNSKEAPFDDARLKIEYNTTDGDAGLQFFIDAEAWRHVTVTNPRGGVLVDVDADQLIRNYGLSELFSESSEPPFSEFPFARFKQLFPEGTYTFTGRDIDDRPLRSTFKLSHLVPDAPKITSPTAGATLPADAVTVEWQPVTTPAGVHVVAYEVLVVADESGLGTAERTVDITLPATATRLPIPSAFLTPGGYKTEVLAIDRNGNQTLTETAFSVS
jgi:hypothetical protein